MENKKFWLGILAITLVFGMTVVGCDNNSGNSGKNDPDFDLTIKVNNIPGDRNGESFTMSLIDKNNSTFVSKGGKITNNGAEADFIVKKMPSLDTREGTFGRREYTCYLTIKIGDDAPITSTDVIGIGMADDGTVCTFKSTSYSSVFGED
jgi:hypothetical protein